MGQIRPCQPVKLIIGAITGVPDLLEETYRRLSERLGQIDYTSPLLQFDHTTYYEAEMGSGLHRQFVSYETLIPPDELSLTKIFSNDVERDFVQGDSKSRQVNLDPGYVSASKLVLASTKDHAHRIYLERGIYAEITLRFHGKTFHAWEWTYPDYQTQVYIDIFNHIRGIYMTQIRASGVGTGRSQ